MVDPRELPIPDDPIERVIAFAKDLAYGVIAGDWKVSYHGSVMESHPDDEKEPYYLQFPENHPLNLFFKKKWNYTVRPTDDALIVLGYLKQKPSPILYQYRGKMVESTITKKAFDLLDIASATPQIYFENNAFGKPSTEKQFLCDVFVIMPFADEFMPIYDDHIKKVVEDMSHKIIRGDDSFSRRSVMNKIWSQMNNAKLIIAECTGQKPNVFYELGMAHTLDKSVVMITQNIKDIPFDIHHLEVIEYEYTPRGTIKLEEKLKSAIEKLL